MAAKTKTLGFTAVMKPVISTDVMGNRNVEIKPVGAWVQPATEDTTGRYPNAIVAAIEEEDRIFQMQQQKEERLRRFQDDVKKRVRHLSLLKKQQQAKSMVQSSERERHVVRQSTLSAERLSSRRDRCLVRKHPDLTISSNPVTKQTQDGWTSGNQQKRSDVFSDQTNQVHEFTSEARRKLGGRQILTGGSIPDDLPGGFWGVSHTRENRVSRSPAKDPEIDVSSGHSDGHSELDSDDECQEKFIQDEREEERENRLRRQLKTVKFDLSTPHDEMHPERIQQRRVPMAGTIRVPEIYMGVAAEEERRRRQGQAALYRRLFMDQEREQVREHLSRQQHRKRIQKLKHDKEVARQAEEDLAHRLACARDPLTGETADEALVREQLESTHLRDALERHEQRRRKNREMERYVDALRHALRERMELRGTVLPPLCCCGTALWDTNPDTCANNCFYYKNPRAYAKALQSLLLSCDVAR